MKNVLLHFLKLLLKIFSCQVSHTCIYFALPYITFDGLQLQQLGLQLATVVLVLLYSLCSNI